MPKKAIPAKHRIIVDDTTESIARRSKILADVEAEKDELIARAKTMFNTIIAQRNKLAAIVKDLRTERERQGLSLADIAERTGMDRSFISRLETADEPNPTVSTLHRYAEALGIELRVALVK